MTSTVHGGSLSQERESFITQGQGVTSLFPSREKAVPIETSRASALPQCCSDPQRQVSMQALQNLLPHSRLIGQVCKMARIGRAVELRPMLAVEVEALVGGCRLVDLTPYKGHLKLDEVPR